MAESFQTSTLEQRETRLLSPLFISRLERLDILSRKILAGKLRGEKIARRHGTSVDLADFRDYSPGDDVRFIDWNAYARLDRLLLKLFLAEEDFFLHVLLDTSASCDYGELNKAVFLQQVAAALGFIGLINQGWVTITAMTDGITAATGLLRSRSRLPNLLSFIAEQKPCGPSEFAQSCSSFIRARRHKGICVVLSDFLFRDGLREGLRLLAAAGHEIYCIQVLSPQELEPAIDDDVELLDLETGQTIHTGAAAIEPYKRKLKTHCAAVEAESQRIGAVYVSGNTSVPFDRLVLDCLRRRGLLA